MFRVKVRVKPDARRETVIEIGTHEFSISVKEPAAGNMANTRVRELVADFYRVPLAQVRFTTGLRGHTKTLEVVS